jgi:hypothetical protein
MGVLAVYGRYDSTSMYKWEKTNRKKPGNPSYTAKIFLRAMIFD